MQTRKYFAAAFLVGFTLVSLASEYASATNIVGWDKDAHGCLGSAGYSWSAPMKKCIRTWEYYSIDAGTPSSGIPQFDAILQKKSDQIVADFRARAESQIAEMGTWVTAGKPTLDISYSLENTGSVVSVVMQSYGFLGGAHGMTTSYSFNYHKKSGKLITLSQVVPKAKLATLEKSVRAILAKKLGDYGDLKWINEGTSTSKLANFDTFALHTDAQGKLKSITFYFEQYQVAPYAAGRQSATVKYPSFEVGE